MAFLNPKIALFFLALLGSFVPEDSTMTSRAGIALLAMGIDATWYMLAAAVLVRIGLDRWLADRAWHVAVTSGVLFVLVGIGVLVELAL